MQSTVRNTSSFTRVIFEGNLLLGGLWLGTLDASQDEKCMIALEQIGNCCAAGPLLRSTLPTRTFSSRNMLRLTSS